MESNEDEDMKHHKERHFGKELSVITIEGKKYFVGVQIAKVLNKEV